MRNIGKPPVKVRHADLDRWSERSPYKSLCPACVAGILMVRRDGKTGRMEELDSCLSCGQAIVYGDIERLREKEAKTGRRIQHEHECFQCHITYDCRGKDCAGEHEYMCRHCFGSMAD